MTSAKIFSTQFNDTKGWTLVNDYTIHEARRLKDRPFMLTCVPKLLHVELYGLRAVECIEWADNSLVGDLTVDDEGNLVRDKAAREREGGYTHKRWISGKGKFADKITVFTVADGATAQFFTLENVRITSVPRGHVGGKHKATTFDGISFSGMSSRDVPEGGFMEGEPGYLWLNDGNDEHKNARETLNAALYLDEAQFDAIFEGIRDAASNVEDARLEIVAELFESEMQASLSEPWMRQEYGILKKGDWVSTRARAENVQVSFGGRLPVAPVDTDNSDDKETPDDTKTPDDSKAPATYTSFAHDAETKAIMKRLYIRSGWILAALGVLVIATLLN